MLAVEAFNLTLIMSQVQHLATVDVLFTDTFYPEFEMFDSTEAPPQQVKYQYAIEKLQKPTWIRDDSHFFLTFWSKTERQTSREVQYNFRIDCQPTPGGNCFKKFFVKFWLDIFEQNEQKIKITDNFIYVMPDRDSYVTRTIPPKMFFNGEPIYFCQKCSVEAKFEIYSIFKNDV